MVLQILAFEKIDFVGPDAPFDRLELQQGGAGAITGRTKDIVIVNQRRGDVGGRIGDGVVAPEKLAADSASMPTTPRPMSWTYCFTPAP